MKSPFGLLGLAASLSLVACGQSGTGSVQNTMSDEVYPATVSSRDFGDYELHFNALVTSQLDEQIANEYRIVRSNSRVLLNVSVLRKEGLGLPKPVTATVKASARNLTGQFRDLATREINEEGGEGIYYIAETGIVNAEALIFTVEAIPEGETEPLIVQFQKQFYVDN